MDARSEFLRLIGVSVALAAVVACLPVWASEPYRLGIDDVIAVHVLYHDDLSVPAATVGPDGMVSLPVVGEITASGLSTAELAGEIARLLAAELRDPRVTVRLVARHLTPIYVLGAVRSPGAFDVTGPVGVNEAIALAEGLSPAVMGRHAVVIDREGNGRALDFGVSGAEVGAAEIMLAPGETLVVGPQLLLTVTGQVRSPGRYPLEEGARAAELVAVAGGLTEVAAERGMLVRADGTTVEVDLTVAAAADADTELQLAQGDLLIVPEVRRRVSLVGAFGTPGRYNLDEGDRVSDALALAGDVADDARLDSALLVRSDGSSERVDVAAILGAEETAANPRLEDGDTLVLPRDTERVAVVGMVVHPGPITFRPGMTLLDAVAAAGGWEQQQSRPDKAVLWRQSDGGPVMAEFDAQAVLRGQEGVENPALLPGDVVFIPRDGSITRDEVARLLLGVSGLLRIMF